MPTNTTSSDSGFDHQPGIALTGVTACQGYLRTLVRRIAGKDRDALIVLYELLWTKVLDDLRPALPDPADAVAVGTATFLEVWLLARFHTRTDDVYTWMGDIMARRVADRARASGPATQYDGSCSERIGGWLGWAALVAAYDRQTDHALASLLARPAGDADEARDDGCLQRLSEKNPH